MYISIIHKFIKYGLVGCINTAVTLVVIFAMHHVLQTPYWLNYFCGMMVGIFNSFALNAGFTFKVEYNFANLFIFLRVVFLSLVFGQICLFNLKYFDLFSDEVQYLLGCIAYTFFSYFLLLFKLSDKPESSVD